MKSLLLILLLLTGLFQKPGKGNDYERSLKAYRDLKTDSALFYIERAIKTYGFKNPTDSLVLSYVQKADIIWREKGIPQGMAVIDMALLIVKNLPQHSLARVAAFNKKGQIHIHNMETDKGKQFLLMSLNSIPSNQQKNDIVATLYNNLSWLYLELQDFKPALQYATRAKLLTEALYGKNARQLMGVYQSLTLITHDAGQYPAAEKYGLELYRLAKKHLPPDHPNLGLIHNDLGTVYESMHRFDEALFHRQQMVKIIQKDYAKNKNPQLLAIAYNNMGNLYETIGEYSLTQDYFEKALQLHEINYGKESPGIVRPLTHLANARREMGNFKAADALYLKAYKLQKKLDANDPLNLAYVETQYGDLFLDQQRYATAADYYTKALRHYQQSGTTETDIVESTRSTLAQAYSHLQRGKEAVELLNSAQRVYRKRYPKGHIIIAGQLHKLCEAYLFSGQLTTAARYSDSVFLELLKVHDLPSGHWLNKLPYNFHIIKYLATHLTIKGLQYEKTGNVKYLKELIRLTEDYGNYLENSLPALRTQAAMVKVAADHRAVYHAAIEACWVLHGKTRQTAYLERAFMFAERSRALLLRLAGNTILVDAGIAAQSTKANPDLEWRKKISALNTRYLNEGGVNDTLLTQLSNAMESYRKFQDSMRIKGNPEQKLKYRLKPFSLAEIRSQLLNNGETMLEYVVTHKSIFVFVLNQQLFRFYKLPLKAMDDVKALQALAKLGPQAFRPPASRLYSQLIAPVRADISTRRLLIIPDADLYALNFELLLSDDNEQNYDKLHYLIRDYDISYLLSAASAIQFKAAGSKSTDKALFLAPVFTDQMKKAYLKSRGNSLTADPLYSQLLRQPFALKAINDIVRYIKGDLISGQKAGEELFKQTAGNYGILHLGTHAEINNAAPLQSRLFFAKPLSTTAATNEDGDLYAYEIYAMQIKAELAVLTACETGVGPYYEGEGVISLAHSFMYAGCPSIVMSLWKIDEKSSASIITDFYKYLSAGKTKSESLRLAKLAYLQTASGEMANPYYWAGLTLIGDDRAVYANYHYWPWLAGAGILLIATGWWFHRKKVFT